MLIGEIARRDRLFFPTFHATGTNSANPSLLPTFFLSVAQGFSRSCTPASPSHRSLLHSSALSRAETNHGSHPSQSGPLTSELGAGALGTLFTCQILALQQHFPFHCFCASISRVTKKKERKKIKTRPPTHPRKPAAISAPRI